MIRVFQKSWDGTQILRDHKCQSENTGKPFLWQANVKPSIPTVRSQTYHMIPPFCVSDVTFNFLRRAKAPIKQGFEINLRRENFIKTRHIPKVLNPSQVALNSCRFML